MQTYRQSGVTLIELMTTVTVLAILVALAVPAMGDFVEKRRLIGAAEEIYNQLQFARSEAIKQSTDIFVNVNTGTWCVGINDGAACDCSGGDCNIPIGGVDVMKVVNGNDFQNIAIATTLADFRFDNVRGTVPGGGPTVTVTSPRGWEIRVITSTLGRVRMCSPAGANNVAGYPTC